MSMRITFNSQFRDGAAGIETASERLIEAQRQVATGKRLNKVSDDPSAASTAVAERNALGAIEQYTRTSDGVGVAAHRHRHRALRHRPEADAGAVGGDERPWHLEDAPSSAPRWPRSCAASAPALLDNFNTSFQGTFVFSRCELHDAALHRRRRRRRSARMRAARPSSTSRSATAAR